MNDEITLLLNQFAYGGEALGKLGDGRTAFVSNAIPGEMVRIRLVEEKPRYIRGELIEVINPSPERITPRCAHFGICSGCHYQHIPYELQLEAKRGILIEQLNRIGGLVDPPVLPVVPSLEPFCYRNYVQFHLSPEGKLGYQKARSHEVMIVQECHLPEPALSMVWSQLDFEALPELKRMGLRLGMYDDVQVTLESDDPLPPELNVEEMDVSIVHINQGEPLVLVGSPDVTIEVLERPFRVSAGSFFQVNTTMAGALVEHLLATIPKYHSLKPDTLMIDAYCGVGLFSAFLVDKVGILIGIETSSSAVDDFVANLDSYENVSVYQDTVERVLPHLGIKPDILLLDPPRQGIDRDAMDSVLELSPYLLVYVSCDPATLARDARRLVSGGYNLNQITPFDLFPQTYHIESVSFWMKN